MDMMVNVVENVHVDNDIQVSDVIVTELANVANFRFHQQGIWVGVAYESHWFVGIVIEILSRNIVTIQFIYHGPEDTFKWPRCDDIANVEANFIFVNDLDLCPVDPCR